MGKWRSPDGGASAKEYLLGGQSATQLREVSKSVATIAYNFIAVFLWLWWQNLSIAAWKEVLRNKILEDDASARPDEIEPGGRWDENYVLVFHASEDNLNSA